MTAPNLAIAGAGMAGAYLYRLLRRAGYRAHLYDRPISTRCGLSPCAWGTTAEFVSLVAATGLDPEKYVLQRHDCIVIDDLCLTAELITFDKPRLIGDLLEGAEVLNAPLTADRYDRVIDASGVSRALLPPVACDLVLDCCQYQVESLTPLDNRVRLGGIGYAWCFPLSAHRYHIGCGSLLADPRRILAELRWLRDVGTDADGTVRCGCTGRIRLTGPHASLPFVTDVCREGVWGVGEAIGCVAPLAGDGIVPGMRSVQLLLEHWDSPERYTAAILKEFRWMKGERGVVERLQRGEGVGLRDARVLRKNSQRMGMRVGLGAALHLLRHAR